MARILLFLALLAGASCKSTAPEAPGKDGFRYPEQILTLAQRRQEIQTKVSRVVELLRNQRLGGVLLSNHANVAWITAGTACDEIFPCNENGDAVFIGDDSRQHYICRGNISSDAREDLKSTGFEINAMQWYADTSQINPVDAFLREHAGGRPIGADIPFPGAHAIENNLRDLRLILTETEIQKYRWLGARTAEVVEYACRRVEPGMTERGVEMVVAADLLRHAIRPIVLSVSADGRVIGGDERFPAGTRKLEKQAVIRLEAGRWGLIAALTRTVHFGPLPHDLRSGMVALARINAGFWARTVPGAKIGEILQGAMGDYAAAGDDAGWRGRPQGGIIGYSASEGTATPESAEMLHSNQAFAWSPSLGDLRAEDTVLLVEESFEVITATGNWPVVESEALGRIYRTPAILIR